MTETQKRTAWAIVNVFETGTLAGRYGAIARSDGDPGRLTYGRSQASLASGSLYRLLDSYCEAPDAACSQLLSPYLDRLRCCDASLDDDEELCRALEEAAADPVMHGVQDRYFEADYFDPALRAAARAGLATPLAQAVVFDSFIQGGWLTVERKVFGQWGPVSQTVPERQWVGYYIDERRAWLTSLGGLLAHTTYRMDAFAGLMAARNFELELPLGIRGVRIDQSALGLTETAGQLESRPAF
jgi:chitosanase